MTPEELQQVDGEAMKAEVEKLTSLGVVKTIDETERREGSCRKIYTFEGSF